MRLGDDIDDYCSRCILSTTHAVVSMAGAEAQRVRCRTCNHEHSYRKNKGGRGPMSKKEAFDKVMASILGTVEENKKLGKR